MDKKIKFFILCFLVVSLMLGIGAKRSKAKSAAQRSRGSKASRDRTTVVSCRVFRRGVCPLTNKIKGLTGITSHGKCQEACYSFNGCSAFTFYRKAKRVNCNLFSNCNGKLGKCNDCVSGPVMPRVRECLAERQVMAPAPSQGSESSDFSQDKQHNCSCHNCCTAICVGPKCPDLAKESAGLTTIPSFGETTKKERQTLEDYDVPEDDYNDVENVGQDAVESIYDDDYYSENEYEDDAVTAASAETTTEYEYDNIEDNQETTTDYYDTDYGNAVESEAATVAPTDEESDVVQLDLDEIEDEVRIDFPLESEGIEEEEFEGEEVEMNIDSGLLSDSSGVVVDLPPVNPNPAQPTTQPTYIFYFCAIGGFNTAGSIAGIDMLNLGQAGVLQVPPRIAPLPSSVTQGTGEVMASYTGSSILSCSPGYTILTPYGFQYLPGSCYDFNLGGNAWQSRGGRMNAYRQGASIIKLGRYMVAIGGHREKRRLRSMEAYDPARPRLGWRRVPRMVMPVSASQHCAVTVRGDKGKEIIIIGGKGRENRVLKYGVNTNRWYSLNRLTEGRRKHACAKVNMNGRPGVIVSGGRNRHSSNLTSVEFYDSKTGVWFKMPSLNVGRTGHQMTLKDGLLTVIGGETVGRRGRKLYLDNSEVFTGKRWVKSKVKLDKPRSGFSMVKIPRKVERESPRNRIG